MTNSIACMVSVAGREGLVETQAAPLRPLQGPTRCFLPIKLME